MEPDGSSPHSQVPVTYPNSEPDRSSQCPYIPFLEDPSKYYPPLYALVFRMVSFPQVFPHQNPVYTSPLPHTCCMPRPSSDFPTKTLLAFPFSPKVPHAPPVSSPWSGHRNNIWWRIQIMKFLIMQCMRFSSISTQLSQVPHNKQSAEISVMTVPFNWSYQ